MNVLPPRYRNQLEPSELLNGFVQHPPPGFDAQRADNGLIGFTTRLDLLTTAAPSLLARLRRWPGYHRWKQLLWLETCFIGATTSEYACLPQQPEPVELLDWIADHCSQQPLTIIKDLPCASPLLTQEENDYSDRLSALAQQRGFISVAGQALAWVAIDFTSIDHYLMRLSHSRRRHIRRKLRSRHHLRIERLPCGDARFNDACWQAQLYQCYLAVWQQSDIHFDRLSPAFFNHLLQDAQSDGMVFCYWHQQQLVGFNLCYRYQGRLVDKYIGFDYALALKFNLYVVSWMVNLEYALAEGLQAYIAGWTDPQVKASLGAQFTWTRHLVRARHPLLRGALRCFRHHLEHDSRVQQGGGL